ncbi:MAG: 2-hexaprenyl-6-methoxy-1,4-benzoquinone methyltransferase [Chaenotheca gracillima]|nr:MAG: 2-hexaprenyl-6-methoxy-1,4-benzoquinone methyltransferase [Chaenotheca gracillima]
MPGSTSDVEASNSGPSEQSPLLGNEQRAEAGPSDDSNGTAAKGKGKAPNDDPSDVPIPEEVSNLRLTVTLGSIYVGVFLGALDSTVVSTLAASISSSFNSLSLLSWLASAYLIANAALQPISGRLTDIFSRQAGLIFSNVFFGLGNLICGLATEAWMMIAGRVVAGMGGGGLMIISTFVGSDLVPLRKRGIIQGLGNVCFGTGMGLGGVFGGWVNDVWGWRKAFLVQIPFVIVSTILVGFLVRVPVKKTNKPRLKRVDFLGVLFLILSLVLLLLGLNSGGNIVPWTHPLVLTSLPLSAVSLLIFIYVEEKVASEPIIPVRLLLNRTVAAACLTNWFTPMAVFSYYFYMPIYFQVQGYSTTQAGIRVIPQSIGAAIGSLGAGLIMRATGKYYVLNIFSQFLSVGSYALICTLTLSTPSWPPFVYLFLNGLGYGCMLTITLLALIAAIDHSQQAVVTSASYAFRSTGSTIGVTVASAVFQNILKRGLWARFGDRDDAVEVIGRIRENFDEIRTLPLEWRQGVLDSYMGALRGVFLTGLAMSTLAAIISLFMRQHTLHKNLSRT